MTAEQIMFKIVGIACILFGLYRTRKWIKQMQSMRLNEYGQIVEANEHDARQHRRKFKNE